MRLLKVSAVAACTVLLTAATRGTQVSQAQISQFRAGVATVTDVEGKLGMPQKSGPSGNNGTALDYILLDESANAASVIPLARLVAGAMNVHEVRVEFQFDQQGHLAAVQTDQRDMVCPHRVCGADQMNQPWTPASNPGD